MRVRNASRVQRTHYALFPSFSDLCLITKKKNILRGMQTFTHVSELNLVTKEKAVFVIDLRS